VPSQYVVNTRLIDHDRPEADAISSHKNRQLKQINEASGNRQLKQINEAYVNRQRCMCLVNYLRLRLTLVR
jgi:hypothetical protein